jgi:DNA polymerase-1
VAGNEGADGGQLSLDAAEEGEASLDPAEEAQLVAALADAQRPRIDELNLARLLNEIELPLVHVLAAIEREGLKLDAERLAEVGAGFGERIETLEREIFELAEEVFTIGSPQQVGRVLFEKLGLTRKRRGKTGFSTDARVLAQIREDHPIVEKIESWRELTKLKNT